MIEHSSSITFPFNWYVASKSIVCCHKTHKTHKTCKYAVEIIIFVSFGARTQCKRHKYKSCLSMWSIFHHKNTRWKIEEKNNKTIAANDFSFSVSSSLFLAMSCECDTTIFRNYECIVCEHWWCAAGQRSRAVIHLEHSPFLRFQMQKVNVTAEGRLAWQPLPHYSQHLCFLISFAQFCFKDVWVFDESKNRYESEWRRYNDDR